MFSQGITLEKIEHSGRLVVPYALLFFMILLHFVPLNFLPAGFEKPYFVLMSVFYWSVYRPTLLPPALCFVIGLVVDILSGMPLGLNAFMIVLVHWVVKDQRRFLMAQSYGTIWGLFGFLSLLTITLQWFLFGFSNWQWGGFYAVLLTSAATALVFPFITLLHIWVHRMLPVASKAYH